MTSSPDDRCRRRCRRCGGVLKLGYRHEPRLMLGRVRAVAARGAARRAARALAQAARRRRARARPARWCSSPLLGLGACRRRRRGSCASISTRVQRRFRDRVTIALESHVARLQASVATIAHHERPDYLDRLAVLRDQVFVLDHMYMSLFSTCGWILRLAVTVALLMSIHPALVLLAVFALPTVLTSTWRPAVERAAEERGASANRLARHLFRRRRPRRPARKCASRGIGARLVADAPRARGSAGTAPVARGALASSALWHALGVGGLRRRRTSARSCSSRRSCAAPAGDVLLVLAAGSRLSAYIGATVGEIGFLRGIWMDGSRRLAWLEDYAASIVGARRRAGARRACARASASSTCRSPIPAPTRLVLDDVSLDAARRHRSSRSSARTARARARW